MTNVSPYLRLVPRSEADARKAILSRYAPAEATFARTQSQSSRELPWEHRAKPVEPMWKSLVAGVCILIFIAVILMVTA